MKRSAPYVFCKSATLVFFRLLMPYRIISAESMPKSSRVIVCYNHLTFKGPVLLTVVAGRGQVNFMAKMELFKSPLLGSLFRKVGAFIINRDERDSFAVNHTQELLQEEQVVGIFIEGTRLKDGALLQPKSGAVMLAFQNNTPILPVYVTGREGIFPKLFHRVDVVCGPPIIPEQLQIEKSSDSEYRQASCLMMDRVMELRSPALIPKALKREEPQ